MTAVATTRRELDHRLVDGLSVALLWDAEADRAFVAVDDARSGEAFELEVRAGERALDVFHHPYAFAAQRASNGQHPRLAEPPGQVAAGA
jgi:hypothetical protein